MAGLCQVEVDTQSLAGCQTAHPSGACGTGSLLCDPDSCLTLGPINPVSPCDMPCSWELTHTEDTSVDPTDTPYCPPPGVHSFAYSLDSFQRLASLCCLSWVLYVSSWLGSVPQLLTNSCVLCRYCVDVGNSDNHMASSQGEYPRMWEGLVQSVHGLNKHRLPGAGGIVPQDCSCLCFRAASSQDGMS